MISVIKEDISTPRGFGRGRGMLILLCSCSWKILFTTWYFYGDSQVTPGFPSINRDVASPLSRPVYISHESRHNSSTISSNDALATEIFYQMGDAIQQFSQKVVQNIIAQLSPSVSNPLTNGATSPSNADLSTSNMLDSSCAACVPQKTERSPMLQRGQL